MSRSQESFNKKAVRNKKEKKRKEKELKKLARKEKDKTGSFEDMIAYVDENGMITSTPPDPEKKQETKLEDIEIGVPKHEEEDPVRNGVVAYFAESKGYGFIRDNETNESVFMHVNNITEDVAQGDKVSYEVEMGPKGPTAVNVKVIK